jgi:hypothetical protein
VNGTRISTCLSVCLSSPITLNQLTHICEMWSENVTRSWLVLLIISYLTRVNKRDVCDRFEIFGQVCHVVSIQMQLCLCSCCHKSASVNEGWSIFRLSLTSYIRMLISHTGWSHKQWWNMLVQTLSENWYLLWENCTLQKEEFQVLGIVDRLNGEI